MAERYYPGTDHKSRVLIGDPRALAYQWIVEYAKNISPEPDPEYESEYADTNPVDADELIETALTHQGENSWGDYICRGGTFEGFSVDPTFWDKFAIVTGIEREEVSQNSFFTCSC